MSDWFVPIQFTIGDDCLTCHGAGTTPKHFYVQFQGIMKGDNWNPVDGQPPNHLYELTQNPLFPCKWLDVVVGGYRIFYNANPANTVLQYMPHFPLLGFTSTTVQICRGFHYNDLDVAAGNHFYGGFAIVFTPAAIQAIIEKHTPVVDPDPLLQAIPMSGGQVVCSYIDRWGDTKFKMKVDDLL